MKVRLRTGWVVPGRPAYRAGHVVDVPDEVGQRFIDTNQADPVEAATVKAPEQAARTKPPEAREIEDLTVAELEALCAEGGIDIEKLEGSGKDGRVIRADLVAALKG